MDINQMNAIEEEVAEVAEEKFDWPQAYYLPTEGDERKKALDKAVSKGLEPEKNQIRKEIWERRYGEQEGVDRFLTGWLNLSYYANVVRNNLMAKFHKNDMAQTQKYLCYDIVKKYGKDGEEVLFMELYHLVDFYIDICLRDKKYGGIILGLGTMKEERLIEKIANDIYRVSYCVPSALGIMDEHELLAKAAVQCYFNRFPGAKDSLNKLLNEK